MLSTKLALRLAKRWQTTWEATRKPQLNLDYAWDRFESRFDMVRRVRQRLDFTSAGLFPLGVGNLNADLRHHLGELTSLAGSLRDEITASRRCPDPDLNSWLAEVRQLEAEFGGVEVQWKESIVRVITEPITLREVELGQFAIDFDWSGLGTKKSAFNFEIVALDPNPASGNDDVTHPHVMKGSLCAGDASVPLQRALEQGRFAEAFLIIQSVLTTYNPASPYVKLEQWSGTPCKDCGCRVEDEDRYLCESCDADMCERCATSCAVCSSTRCSGCLEACAICHSDCCSACLENAREDERICSRCFARCVLCGGRVPKDELVDRHCPACTLDEEETDDDDEVVETADETDGS
jgi:hypothetical protein